MLRICSFAIAVLALVAAASAAPHIIKTIPVEAPPAFRLPAAIGSNMAFQRDTPFKVWGFSEANADISVTLDSGASSSFTRTTTASAAGEWVVVFDAVKGGPTPYEIAVTNKLTSEVIKITNIVFGDVFVCGGQSNMQLTVSESINGREIAAKANHTLMRLMQVSRDPSYLQVTAPQSDMTPSIVWSMANTNNVVAYFSGACYFAGLEILSTVLSQDNIPVGLIDSCWGGTPIEFWSDDAAQAKCQKFKPKKRVGFALKGWDAKLPQNGGSLWNAMIYPLLQLPIKGALWYQGEANAGDPARYSCLFPAMIEEWRAQWAAKGGANPTFPFAFVQLSTWPGGGLIANQRWAQTAALALPNVGMAVAMDIGNLASPSGNIHPPNKEEVGRRLSLNLLKYAYNKTDVVDAGPIPVQVKYDDSGSALRLVSVQIKFGNVGKSGLNLLSTQSPFNGFEILTYTTSWAPVEASVVDHETIRLSFMLDGGETAKPVPWLRYAWSDVPLASVFNPDAYLPAAPFCMEVHPTGNWEAPKFLAPGTACPANF